jgi:carbon storage regulator
VHFSHTAWRRTFTSVPSGRRSLSEGFEDALANDRDAVLPRRVATTVLVLTRKTNQSIMIGDDVEISILSVAGDKVRIGIAAPREIGVFRKEVYAAREAEDAKTPDPAGGEKQ